MKILRFQLPLNFFTCLIYYLFILEEAIQARNYQNINVNYFKEKDLNIYLIKRMNNFY